jgi:hypothetical protein
VAVVETPGCLALLEPLSPRLIERANHRFATGWYYMGSGYGSSGDVQAACDGKHGMFVAP